MSSKFRTILSVFSLCLYSAMGQTGQSGQKQKNIIWDSMPAREWMSDAYPMGNGRMGGMAFGGINQERIQFNEMSLWTGDESETGSYQSFGDLFIETTGLPARTGLPRGYRRELDLSDAVQRVSYSIGEVEYKREYFCSFPAKMAILRFSANKKKGYSVNIRLRDSHGRKTGISKSTLSFSGRLQNGLAYQASAKILADNGSFSSKKDSNGDMLVTLSGSDGFTVMLTAATDYANSAENRWRGESPKERVGNYFAAVKGRTYSSLLKEHLDDYRALFGRVALQLGNFDGTKQKMPTRQRIAGYRAEGDPSLDALLFQYGRYLLISSSRKGGLPANLQGMWNESNDPPWRSDYHSNINIQMNYWPAEPTNLAECQIPYLDYINSIRSVARRNTIIEYPGVRGWTVRTENNIFGGSGYVWNTPASAWYAQGIWEHFAFGGDRAYLDRFAYPILKEVTEFWDDHLKRRSDGTLVSPKGWSPEHGPTEDGVSYDQEIVYDLFTNYIRAASILGRDTAYRARVERMRGQLLQPKIGRWGQLQEWETDRDDPKDLHRHASHLFGLYPGKQFGPVNTPDMARAAEISLTARGDASTGWSMAWKMNFWARLLDGNHARAIMANFITPAGGSGIDYNNGGGLYPNMLCAHPPFQIDGNLGYTAGVAEMLLQSQTGEIYILPAIPDAWKTGTVSGLRARGGFEVSELMWTEGRTEGLVIRSGLGGPCRVRSRSPLVSRNKKLRTTRSGADFLYTFNTIAGETINFSSGLP